VVLSLITSIGRPGAGGQGPGVVHHARTDRGQPDAAHAVPAAARLADELRAAAVTGI
jgi:hypothetical protein